MNFLAKEKKQKISKEMSFQEVLSKYPDTIGIMLSHGLHCVGCHAAAFETIEQGAKAHGMDDKQLKKMIEELNEAAEKK